MEKEKEEEEKAEVRRRGVPRIGRVVERVVEVGGVIEEGER